MSDFLTTKIAFSFLVFLFVIGVFRNPLIKLRNNSIYQKFESSLFYSAVLLISIVITRKFGANSWGEPYSEPRTWHEIRAEAPVFIFLFIASFVVILLFKIVGKKKEMICPNCEEPFISYRSIEESYCPSCKEKGVLLKGYFDSKSKR